MLIELHYARGRREPISLNPRYVVSAIRHAGRSDGDFTEVVVELSTGTTRKYGVSETPEEIVAMSRTSTPV